MKQHDLAAWVEAIWRRRAVAIWTAAGIFALIFVGTVVYPPLYESSARILVSPNRAHYVVSPALQTANDPNAPVVNDREVTEQDLNSEMELVTQRRLIERALSDLSGREPGAGLLATAWNGLSSLPDALTALLHGARLPSALERRSLALEKRVGASVIRKSNLLEVTFRARDPNWCREFLATLLKRYFELHAQIVHDVRSERFFDQQIRRRRDNLHAAEDHLRAVREQTGILSLPDQSEAVVYQLSGFQAEYRKNQSRLDGVNRQVAALEDGLKHSPMRLLKEIKSAPNPAYEALKPKVLALQLGRDDVLERYRSGSKLAREVTRQVANAHDLLEQENHTVVVERLSDLSPVWLGLAANLAQARVSAAALGESQRSLAGEIEIYQSELRRLANDGVEVERAMREVEADNEAYISYLRKGEEARAELELNESRIMNVVLAMPPTQPVEPRFPRLGLNLGAGLVLALLAGLAAAWWEERQDPTIYSQTAILESSPVPVVAVLRAKPAHTRV
ncbi:MAG TPA: hypothetical protein VKB84_21395 [Candidatus Binataceae bacterium]|nr:hypothetical protein [Candidatus Binataceae bacterium]